jgi:ribosome-binding protein aMBF1 (putative translation factor)
MALSSATDKPKPRFAIVYKGVVLSRFPTKQAAREALSLIPARERRGMRILRIDTKTVRRYYARVNRGRRRSGLPPLNPAKW